MGDFLRIRLRTANHEGSTVYTKLNGEGQNGSSLNTLFINPVELEDFGIYSAEYTDSTGCVGTYYFNVMQDEAPNSVIQDEAPTTTELINDKTVDINFSTKPSSEYSLYPNPSMGNTEIILTGSGIKLVDIYDLMGKRLSTQSFEGDKSRIRINSLNLESGIYFARINGKEAIKFVVND